MSPAAASMSPVHALNVVPGEGILIRRAAALLFVDGPAADSDALVAAFTAAADGDEIDAVTDASVAAAFEVPAFVLLTWGGRARLVVQGPLEVRTDDPALPMLSGAGSGSWVERRLRLGGHPVAVECGEGADPVTDLVLGRVTAGGFRAVVGAAEPADAPIGEPTPSAHPNTVTPATEDSDTELPPHPAPTNPVPTGPTVSPASADPTRAIDRMAALRAALGTPDVTPPLPDTPLPDPPLPDPPAAAPEVDDEMTIAAYDPPPADGGDHAPFVSAVRCPRGHLNPPHIGACRTCGELLAPGDGPEVVEQPPLALLQLDDGETLPIDRSIVLGRRPDRESAQADGRARLVAVSDDASVSRTHVRIDVEDWTLTVTDCGSRSGTAIVTRPGEEPRVLDPWVPHELPVDARLYLGGPSSVSIRPLPDRGSR